MKKILKALAAIMLIVAVICSAGCKKETQTYSVSVSASPTEGGLVTGSGSYKEGKSCTVTAMANSGYTFVNWTENGAQVSASTDYTFTVTGNRSLVAYFQAQQQQQYTVNVSADPSNGGSVTGGGTYSQGASCTVHATANSGYTFVNWTENGAQVSANAEYTFTVTGNRSLVAHFQAQQQQQYTVNVSADPSNGGSVTGGGTYNQGASCTVHATANNGYTFVNWTENGAQVSTNANYTFNVSCNRDLVANFTQQTTYTISVSANPTEGGTVTGGGNFNPGQSCTLTANANDGYVFSHWQDDNTSNPRTFTVMANATYVAYFTNNGGSGVPTGAINGIFSVNASGNKVYFSQGNLQYQASSNTWQFAEHQYDYIGTANRYISSTYNGWIDLFGWGTSNWNHGAVCYYPWSTSANNSDYYAYGSSTSNLNDQTGNADWGFNAISNGGNQTGRWHTLTREEWAYLFNNRATTSGIRYAKAELNNVNGVILLPDDWNSGYYNLSNTNTSGAGFSSNIISLSEWNTLEQHGAIFLPAAGFRIETSVGYVGNYGNYWSASYNGSCVLFNDSSLIPHNFSECCYGFSVRLVCSAQ